MGWIKANNELSLAPKVNTLDKLPKGTYYVRYDQFKGFYLEMVDDFVLPEKIYGDTSIINRWLKGYNNTNKNTGIVLSGIKGSGKTLLSKKLAIDSGLPVIIIDKPFDSSDFVSFITNPEFGNVCIFIDEFEKVYNRESNTTPLLSILDGAFNTHNLFVFTCNEMYTNDYLNNRPSRIKYRSHFESLDSTIVDEVIDDLLINKQHSDSIKKVLEQIGIITFDLLITLIKEVDLFNESAIEVVRYLNVKRDSFQVTVDEIWKGQFVTMNVFEPMQLGSSLKVYRIFNNCKDPEYCDEDYQDDDDVIKGLPERVMLDTNKFERIDQDTWKYKSDEIECIIRRFKYSTYIF